MSEGEAVPAGDTAQAVEAPKVETAAPAPERDPNRVYTQSEMDAIAAKIKKNERYRTKKEVEAFYQGRESVASPAQKQAEPEAPKADAPPERNQFDTYEAFLAAQAAFHGRSAFREERQKADKEAAEATAAQERKTRAEKFQEQLKAKHPDIDSRVEDVAHIVFPNDFLDAVTESEFGPDVLNHLVSNPKDAERIAALSASAALREIGRLEARFEAAKPAATDQESEPAAEQPKPAVKKISAAPAPINPVSGKAVTGDGEPSHDKPEEWMRWRNKQVQKRRTG